MVKAEKKYIKKLGLRTVLNIQHFANYSTGALKDGRPVICFFDATQNPTGSWELADPDGVGEPYDDEENSSTKTHANSNPFFIEGKKEIGDM
ncbi:MAG: hypothetical protein QM398_12315 [Thermoproteota archaeon]|nr:hypothetical protein [Thermoproteota archaeon]